MNNLQTLTLLLNDLASHHQIPEISTKFLDAYYITTVTWVSDSTRNSIELDIVNNIIPNVFYTKDGTEMHISLLNRALDELL